MSASGRFLAAWGFVRNRFSAPSLISLQRAAISGRTILITGASGGLGIEAARHYAQLGASRLILAVRSQAGGDAAKRSILQTLESTQDKTTGSKTRQPPVIDVWPLDLASFESVQSFARRVATELDTLDIALLNAAVSKSQFTLTEDGWEETLQVNLLSNVLLAMLLLPKLQQSTAKTPGWTARLSIVASRGHQTIAAGEPWQNAPNMLAELNKSSSWNKSSSHYAISKLLLIYAINEIVKVARRSDGSCSVIVNYSCPGACKSNLSREWNTNAVTNAVIGVTQAALCKSAEEGSRTLVWATGMDETSHGRWIRDDKIDRPGALVTSSTGARLQEKLWKEVLDALRPYGVST